MSAKGVILAVDDATDMLLIIQVILQKSGFDVVTARNGREALDIISVSPDKFDAIILDRFMPVMGGLELLSIIKNDPRFNAIPVVMLTLSATHQDVQEGISAGAFYYVTKPYDAGTIVAITRAAVNQYREYKAMQGAARQAEHSLRLLDHGVFSYRTIDEANLLTNILAWGFPQPFRVVRGLMELLVNAVEHGNLGIRYDEKKSLLFSGQWYPELMRRMESPEYRHKVVKVFFERRPEAIEVTISDEGKGFDWVKYLNFDPDRVFDPNGRGIAMAHDSFDKIAYLGNGNIVQVTAHTGKSQG